MIPGIAETHLRTSPLVSQAMLVGNHDEKPFVAALVTLDPDTLPEQLEHLGLPRSLSIPEAGCSPGGSCCSSEARGRGEPVGFPR